MTWSRIWSEKRQMLEFWLSQNFLGRAFLLLAAFGSFATIAAWVTYASPFAKFFTYLDNVTPPFSGVSATIFALLVTFLSFQIWENDRQLREAIGRERDDLLGIAYIGEVDVPRGAVLKKAIRAYVDAVVGAEWKSMASQKSAPEAEDALNALERVIASLAISPILEEAALSAMQDLRSARERRLSVAFMRPDEAKWYAAIGMAFVTQIAIAVTHLERLRAQVMAQAIFIALAVGSLSLAGSAEHHFGAFSLASSRQLSGVFRNM
jgi:hypothetical protein